MLPLIAACFMSYADVAIAQHTSICLGFDSITNDEIPLKTNLYVGDQNDFLLKPGENPAGRMVKTTKWTLKTTSTLGVVNTTTFATAELNLIVNRLGKAEIKAEWTYEPDSGNQNPDPSASPTYTITSTPPTGVEIIPAKSLSPDTPCNINGGMGGGEFWFKIKGGKTNNGYNMVAQEKITISTPNLGAQFGGQWVWNNGTGLPTPGNALYLYTYTTGEIKDIKTIDGTICDLDVAAPGVIHAYTQTIGVRVLDMDGTIVNITLGYFEFTVNRLNDTQCTMSIAQIP